MATVAPVRRRRQESFRIHEDVPSTEDAEMDEHAANHQHDQDDEGEPMDEVEDDDSNYSESSEDAAVVDSNILEDMERLQDSFPGFRHKYRLIKRIGEGQLLSSPWNSLPTALLTNTTIQAPSRPSTRPKTSSTTATTTLGIWTKKARSGRLRH